MFGLFSHKKKTNHPDWIQDYLNLDFKTHSSRTLDEIEFIVLDCETTGLSKSDEIITIGAVKCTSRDIFLDQIFDQKYSEVISGKSSEIHGELSGNGEENRIELLKNLINYLQNRIIVGHNISFDIGMINNSLRQAFDFSLKNKVLDTAQLMMRLDPVKYERSVGGNSNLHLDDLCKKFNIPIENRHTALGDAYMTAQLFQRILPQLKKRGLTKIGELIS